jgi:hypothetical protein
VSPPPRAVLDSNVIFSRVLYELLGRVVASLRLLDLIWSDELLAEAERVLIERKLLTPEQASRWVGYLRDAFPDDPRRSRHRQHRRSRDELRSGRRARLRARARRRRRLPVHIRPRLPPRPAHRAPRPGAHARRVLSSAIDREPEAFITLLEEQADAWGGGRPLTELLGALERAYASLFVDKARRLFAL